MLNKLQFEAFMKDSMSSDKCFVHYKPKGKPLKMVHPTNPIPEKAYVKKFKKANKEAEKKKKTAKELKTKNKSKIKTNEKDNKNRNKKTKTSKRKK